MFLNSIEGAIKRGGLAAWAMIKVFLVEVLRISPALIVAGAFLATRRETAGLDLVFTILAAVAVCLAFVHVARKTFFHYLDLRGFCEAARRDAKAAAVVIVATLAFYAFVVWLTITIALGAHG